MSYEYIELWDAILSNFVYAWNSLQWGVKENKEDFETHLGTR